MVVLQVPDENALAQAERRHVYENDLDYVKDVLAEGNRRANEIAEATLAEVCEAMGMIY